jgi:2-dehydro-3-deoxyphosphogluconate aldolase / (4S)-4-hydroxy-2-oxoglutarate aldolase
MLMAQTILETDRLMAILRATQPVDLFASAMALIAGGVRAVEIPMNTPGALAAVTQLRQEVGESAAIGVGTVLSAEDARRAVDAGAQYLVAPVVDGPTIEFASRRMTPMVAGALTPNECFAAHRAGATFVKLFPATAVSPKFLSELLAPLPMLRVIPTGGITTDNAAEWLAAGAVALGVGGSLFDAIAAERKEFAAIEERARHWVGLLNAIGPARLG